MLSVLFLVAVISLSLHFFMLSSSLRIDTSTLPSMLFLLLDTYTYSLFMSFLGYKALIIVISFLVLGSIGQNSSLLRFKNGPENLTRCYPFDKITVELGF